MKKSALCAKLLLVSCAVLLAAKCTGGTKADHKTAKTQPAPKSVAVWPDRDWLLASVIYYVPETLKS